MQNSKIHKKPAPFYHPAELITVMLIVVLFLLCIINKQIIKANYDTILNTIDNGLRQWTIHPKDFI